MDPEQTRRQGEINHQRNTALELKLKLNQLKDSFRNGEKKITKEEFNCKVDECKRLTLILNR